MLDTARTLKETLEVLNKDTKAKQERFEGIIRMNMSFKANRVQTAIFFNTLNMVITALKFSAKDIHVWTSIELNKKRK